MHKTLDVSSIQNIENRVTDLITQKIILDDKIKKILREYTDGKYLKGVDLVNWLGEIYGSKLYEGTLVDEKLNEHDFTTTEGWRVSVKARKGKSWKESSTIPRIHGEDTPTHLLFIYFNEDYSINKLWLF